MNKIVTLLILLFVSPTVFSCSMGVFQNHIRGLPDLYIHTNNYEKLLHDYMTINYSDFKWVYAGNSFYLKIPMDVEINSVIPISAGTNTEAYADKFDKIIILNESHIDITKGEQATSFWQKTDTAVKIEKIATYSLGRSLLPYISMRLNLETSSKSRVIVLFIPIDRSQAIQIVKQEKVLSTRHPCKRTIYIVDDDNIEEEDHDIKYITNSSS